MLTYGVTGEVALTFDPRPAGRFVAFLAASDDDARWDLQMGEDEGTLPFSPESAGCYVGTVTIFGRQPFVIHVCPESGGGSNDRAVLPSAPPSQTMSAAIDIPEES